MKAIITKNVEVRAHKKNAALSLRAGTEPQTLPRWAIEQAIAKGCGYEFLPPKKSEAEEAAETGD